MSRRGADRGQRDSNDCTPLDYAEQRGYTDCIRVLRSYGIQRPSSARSFASHASVNAATDPPTLDEQGHVIFRKPRRNFSLSESSRDRLPADGQAQTEDQQSRDQVESGRQEEGREQGESDEGEGAAEQEIAQEDERRENVRTLSISINQQESPPNPAEHNQVY